MAKKKEKKRRKKRGGGDEEEIKEEEEICWGGLQYVGYIPYFLSGESVKLIFDFVMLTPSQLQARNFQEEFYITVISV